ncbi:hypothetical protein QQG55_41020 [Brugia pahangi]
MWGATSAFAGNILTILYEYIFAILSLFLQQTCQQCQQQCHDLFALSGRQNVVVSLLLLTGKHSSQC